MNLYVTAQVRMDRLRPEASLKQHNVTSLLYKEFYPLRSLYSVACSLSYYG